MCQYSLSTLRLAHATLSPANHRRTPESVGFIPIFLICHTIQPRNPTICFPASDKATNQSQLFSSACTPSSVTDGTSDSVHPAQSPSFRVSTSKHVYAATDIAVSTTTTFPEVRNFFWFRPSSPTLPHFYSQQCSLFVVVAVIEGIAYSEKNCLLPCCLRNKEMSKTPTP